MSEKILCEITDPRNKTVTYYESVNNHIIDGHPEMEDLLPDTPIDIIENPDWIREGRNPENTEMYFKIESRNLTEFYGTMVFTKDLMNDDGAIETTIVTTSFEGKDKSNAKMKWSKAKGEINEKNN